MTQPAEDPLIGTVVADRYEVQRLIGRGGMGSVYLVRHRKLRRKFALKKLAAALTRVPEALARFQREADVIAGFRHPNIVEIVDWETLEDGSPCMIMELLEGEDLGQRIAGAGPLPWPTLARIADETLSALSAAHRAGIVHRDLKPQNIFLARDDSGEERAMLLDFGISKVHESDSKMTGHSQLVGTPAYMSPEQADGRTEDVGPAADVWAMGSILHEMATATLAFDAATTMSILYRICHGQPEPLKPHRADAPRAFVELVGSALSREPGARIVTADALRRELRSALGRVAPNAYGSALPEENAADLEGPTRIMDTGSVPIRVSEPDPPAEWVAPRPRLAPAQVTTLSRASGQVNKPAAPAVPAPAARTSSSSLVAGIMAAVLVVGGGYFAATRRGAASRSGGRQTTIALAPVATVNLKVITHPAGAAVSIDGRRETASTPSTYQVAGDRPSAVVVEKHGFSRHEEQLTFARGELERTLDVWLEPERLPSGTLRATVNVTRSRWTLDGQAVGDGSSPLVVPDLFPGAHTLRVEAVGHGPREERVEVRSNETTRADWILRPLVGARPMQKSAPALEDKNATGGWPLR